MTPDEIQAVVAVATLVTAIAALLTILEMRRQRSVQHRPELVLDDATFVIYCRTFTPDDRTYAVCTGDTHPPDQPHRPWGTCLLVLRNVGLGVARDVTAHWVFDAMKFAELLADRDGKVGGRVWVDGNQIELESPSGPKWLAFLGPPQRLGTIVASSAGASRSLDVLLPYQWLLALHFGSFPRPTEDRAGTFDWSPPPLSLALTYRDIEGRSYSKTILIAPKVGALRLIGEQVSPNTWTEVCQGTFEVSDV